MGTSVPSRPSNWDIFRCRAMQAAMLAITLCTASDHLAKAVKTVVVAVKQLMVSWQ